MRIAVVGLGGTGSAALRFLAKAGHQATGYEQFQIGHAYGSSYGESRIIRYTYPDLLFTEMMSDAYKLWFDLEKEAEENLLVQCGGICFGDPKNANIIAMEKSLIDAGLQYDRLSAEETNKKYPAFHLKPSEIAIYQKDSGFLRATRCVEANIRLAREHGATIYDSTKVEEIIPEDNRALIRTSEGEEEYDRVIVTAGPWMSSLFKQLNLPLVTTRQQIVYLNINDHEEYFEPNGIFPVFMDTTENVYGFPSDGRITGIKLASHNYGEEIRDLSVKRAPVDEDYFEEMRQYAAKRFQI